MGVGLAFGRPADHRARAMEHRGTGVCEAFVGRGCDLFKRKYLHISICTRALQRDTCLCFWSV